MKSHKAIALRIGLVTLVCIGATTVALRLPLPAPAVVEFPVVTGAEVLPGSQVKPGTFTIDHGISEFLELAHSSRSRSIVSYNASFHFVSTTYWLPRDESGVFYRSEWRTRLDWPEYATVGRLEYDGQKLMAHPERNWGNFLTPAISLLTILCGLLSLFLFCE